MEEIVDDKMAEILAAKTPAQRIAIGFALWDFARELLTARLREERQGCPPAQLERELARRMASGSW